MKITPLGKTSLDAAVKLSTVVGASGWPIPGESNKLSIQTFGTAANSVYISIGAAPDTTNLTNVFKIINPGDDWVVGDERDGNQLDLSKIWLVSSSTGDYFIGATYER
jgi:hypothetical protein